MKKINYYLIIEFYGVKYAIDLKSKNDRDAIKESIRKKDDFSENVKMLYIEKDFALYEEKHTYSKIFEFKGDIA